ncbi:Ead domain protein [Klebsiella pneumoniae]|uniref:ead/Ea22-like family protein n=1 Tax=Klebsiella pneumoniae TaxID=573 RepID=UPI001C66F140|nr:ead/Ea22-like family protein [Klebsiella pneumoniae]MBW5949912.1 Ead domain protein [Klebsiella pneumoniae]
MTSITELAQRLKAAADREMICRDVAETSEIWERTVTPENILALVEALEKAQAINAAAEKLVRCKGRYHSEQNYRALAALFGVKTPDLPPLEHENVHYADAAEMEIAALRQRIAELESRTVKLPDLRQIVSGDRYVWSDGVYNYSQDVKVALAAAGIKVEAE